VATGQTIGQPTAAPGAAPAVPVVPTTPPQVYAPSVSRQDNDNSDGTIHIVGPGDTLAAIAVAYHTTVTHIVEINGIDRHAMLNIGQQIIIETPEAEAPPVEATTVDTSAETVPLVATQEVGGPAETVAEPTTQGSSLVAQTTPVIVPVTTEEAVPTTEAPAAATATDQPTNTSIPEATQVAVVPTVQVTSAADAVTSLKAGVCVTFFEDKNQNHFHEQDEPFLAGGLISLRDLQDKEVAGYQTTASSEPHCFTDIPPVTYNLVATAPDGYGLTTPRSLTVSVQVGSQVEVKIGAAQGVAPLVTPTPNSAVVQVVPDADASSPSTGLLVLIIVGLVAVVAIVAGVLIFVIRRL
jgi:LysM repeat protein